MAHKKDLFYKEGAKRYLSKFGLSDENARKILKSVFTSHYKTRLLDKTVSLNEAQIKFSAEILAKISFSDDLIKDLGEVALSAPRAAVKGAYKTLLTNAADAAEPQMMYEMRETFNEIRQGEFDISGSVLSVTRSSNSSEFYYNFKPM